MQAGFRLVAMVLAMTLAGGAQVCLALCTAPAAQTAKTTPEKPACHRCPEKSPAKPNPEPATPCRQCQTATQDRLNTERDHSTLKPATELAFQPLLDIAPILPAVDTTFEVTRPNVHSPPGERLHRYCLLLI
jgi:hypothetical protein